MSKCHKPIWPLKSDDRNLAVGDAEKANKLNVYFSPIDTTLAAQLPAPQTETGTVDDPTCTHRF